MEFIVTHLDSAFMLKVAFALFIGFILGIEREYHAKPAGLKTYAMICLGATIFTHISTNIASPADPSRVAAQIVSGLGFIGAGTIFQSRRFITGLTTAATMWVVGALGTLLGLEFYGEAFFCLCIIYIYFSLSRFIQKASYRKLKFTLEMTLLSKADIPKINKCFKSRHITILRSSWYKKNEQYVLEMAYLTRPVLNQELITTLQTYDFVTAVK